MMMGLGHLGQKMEKDRALKTMTISKKRKLPSSLTFQTKKSYKAPDLNNYLRTSTNGTMNKTIHGSLSENPRGYITKYVPKNPSQILEEINKEPYNYEILNEESDLQFEDVERALVSHKNISKQSNTKYEPEDGIFFSENHDNEVDDEKENEKDDENFSDDDPLNGNPTILDQQHSDHCCGKCRAKMEEIIKQNNLIIRKLDHVDEIIQNRSRGEVVGIESNDASLLPDFPIATVQDFLDFEELLTADRTVRLQFKNKIMRRGGGGGRHREGYKVGNAVFLNGRSLRAIYMDRQPWQGT